MAENKHRGYCVHCGEHRELENAIRTKLRNRRTRNHTVETVKGRCPNCGGMIYVIVGHS